MSDRVERRLVELLDHPQLSPYGNPIPGLVELGEKRAAEEFLDGVVSLVAFARAAAADAPHGASADTEPARAVVGRLGEPVQTEPDLLARLAEHGVTPGASIVVRVGDGVVTVGAPGSGMVLDLPDDVARHVFVRVG